MYCVLNGESAEKFDTADFWDKFIQEIIKRSEEQGVGDLKDRMDTLATNFRFPVQYDQLEEFDGTNHEDAHRYVFVVSLPVIMRGHAIQLKVSSEVLQIRVPNLYNLALGLPSVIHTTEGATAYFECQLRKLIVVVKCKRAVEAAEQPEVDEQKTVVVEVVDTKKLENDMLFDIV